MKYLTLSRTNRFCRRKKNFNRSLFTYPNYNLKFKILVTVGSHEYFSEDELISWGKPNLYRLPWEVGVFRFGCEAILISDKHVLARASCVFRGIDPTTFHGDGTSDELRYFSFNLLSKF